MRIKPRKGVELAGIPAAGADVPAELGREWIAAGLVTELRDQGPRPRAKAKAKATPAAPATEG